MRLKFTKMHGAGNDFIVIDGVSQSVRMTSELAKKLAHRQLGIGADQILLVESSRVADFKYRIFNADGSEVSHCGNGARCFVRFIHSHQLSLKNPISAEISTGIISLLAINHDRVQVSMGQCSFKPNDVGFDGVGLLSSRQGQVDRWLLPLDDVTVLQGSIVAISNPHVVIDVGCVDSAPVAYLGARLGGLDRFKCGVNVGFMQVLTPQHIKLRVYERGVGETLACGTGACAAVVLGIERGILTSPVSVDMLGGQLDVAWDGKTILLSGPTAIVFDGEVDI